MRNEPRISITMLMEYMISLPSRQREIVDNQKNPLANKPKITWCAKARKAIIEFFATGCANVSILDEEIKKLHQLISEVHDKDPKKQKSKINKFQVEIDAINAFKNLYKKLNTSEFVFTVVPKRPKYLDYSGVHVSVRPEILVMSKDWEYIGCIKLYFTKNKRLKEKDADFICTVLNHYADKHLSPKSSANPNACMVLDIFGECFFTASKNAPLHAGEIRKNCKEIRDMWDTIPTRKPIGGKNDDNQLNLGE